MTFLKEMLIKILQKRPTKKLFRGFTLLETLAATGIASIVITSSLGIVASIYFSQKRVQFSQDFYAESRYLMERISQVFRNNTIDYDRFFEAIGPSPTSCSGFDARQALTGANLENNNASAEVNQKNRETLTYPGIFYWDTNGDGTQDRNLGGKLPDGASRDNCALAWDEAANLTTLYLINSSKTLRTAISFEASNNTVQIERQLGADTDGDGNADIWAPSDMNDDGDYADAGTESDALLEWNTSTNECEIHFDKNGDNLFEQYPIHGDESDEDFCDRGHEKSIISPIALKVNALTFDPSPSSDPFLNFRVDEAQIHPHVFINLDVELRNPDRYGFDGISKPVISFQTTVSSRVFGNIRR